MAGNFDNTSENRRGPEESDEFDLDAELADLSSFLQEMGVQLEDEVTGDEVTGGISFDFSDEKLFADTDESERPDFTEDVTDFTEDVTDFTEDVTDFTEDVTDFTEDETDFTDDVSDFLNDEPDFSDDRPDLLDDGPGAPDEQETAENVSLTDGLDQAEETDFEDIPDPVTGSDLKRNSEPAAEFSPEDLFHSEDEPDPKEKTDPDGNDRSEAEKRRRAEKEVDKILRKTFGRPFSWKREVLSWVAMFVVAFALAFIIDNYLIVNATVPTGSMQNTIMAGDRMIGWRLSYLFSEPERGDIIIFEYPDDPEEIYVKRVIGLPGETVTITNGEIYINDSAEPLVEDYLPEEWVWKNDGYTFVVPEDSYLCLGDNRNNSHDARSWTNTYVTKDAILGQAVLCYWPADDFGWLD